MQVNSNKVQIGNQVLDLMSLPDAAQEELLTFYNFLVFKYHVAVQEKQAVLREIFQDAKGKLPAGYRFDRTEIHER